MNEVIIVIIGYTLIVYLYNRIKKKNEINKNSVIKKEIQTKKVEMENNVESSVEIERYPYKKKNLLTKSEYAFYMTLKEKMKNKDLIICPKVRLEDFIEVTDKKEILKYRGKIKSRHIDFLLCDNNLRIKCAIELDDPLHNNKKAMEVDNFKNKLFNEIGLKLYRIAYNEDKNKRIDDILIELNKL